MYYYNVKKKHYKLYFFILTIAIMLLVMWIFNENFFKKEENPSYNITKTEYEYSQGKGTPIIEDTESEETPIEDVMKAVVGISNVKIDGASIFTKNGTEKWGAGTGVIVSSNGYIVTNQHVAGNKGTKNNVTLENGKTYTGTTVWADSVIDLAIVKINDNGLPFVTLGNSDNVKIAETVYAIGNPIGFEFQRTVTSGIISAKNRTVKIDDSQGSGYMEDLLQTDASINEGNSGGPLINKKGEVIGINTIKISNAEAIGFAIPINLVSPIVEKFVTEGTFKEPYIGIFAYDKQVIPYMDSRVKLDKGIYVVKVYSNSPASKANIKTGDIITKLDDTEINTMIDLRSYIYKKNPGDEITLTVNRYNKDIEVKVKLTEK